MSVELILHIICIILRENIITSYNGDTFLCFLFFRGMNVTDSMKASTMVQMQQQAAATKHAGHATAAAAAATATEFIQIFSDPAVIRFI